MKQHGNRHVEHGKILGVLKLTRIEHSVMLVIAVIAAELISAGDVASMPGIQIIALSLITPIFISMASFAINDYFDIEVDRANGKDRPLVNGTLKPHDALYVTAVSLAIGIAASALINAYTFLIAVTFGALAMLYSYKLKEKLFWGNAYIALSMAIPFIFGNYVVSSMIGTGIGLVALMIFISGLGREIHGTIRDMRGDAKRKAHTIPAAIGRKGAAFIAMLLYCMAIAISIILYAAVTPFMHNEIFMLPITAVDLILLYVSVGYLTRSDMWFYGIARNLSLAAMAIALLAILISPL